MPNNAVRNVLIALIVQVLDLSKGSREQLQANQLRLRFPEALQALKAAVETLLACVTHDDSFIQGISRHSPQKPKTQALLRPQRVHTEHRGAQDIEQLGNRHRLSRGLQSTGRKKSPGQPQHSDRHRGQRENLAVRSAGVEAGLELGQHAEGLRGVLVPDMMHEPRHLLLLGAKGNRVVLQVFPGAGDVHAASAALVSQQRLDEGEQAPQRGDVPDRDSPGEQGGDHRKCGRTLRPRIQVGQQRGVVRHREHRSCQGVLRQSCC
mmetsp:Transcript_1099/g.4580  ORF Transcript_1099/g.4580 Transcript_1099/m.4580 type:complete len:264 (-) Transcript_1099:1279-2070(-)